MVIKMATNKKETVTRRNPMTEVVDFKLLEAAFGLMLRKQNFNYWSTVRIPIRPHGHLRAEVPRQIATFAVPLTGFLAVFYYHGYFSALWSLPALYFVGFCFHRNLKKSISAKKHSEANIDRGRYDFTRKMCDQLGLAPEEVTLRVVHKMSEDFMRVDTQMRLEREARIKAQQERERARDATRRKRHSSRDDYDADDDRRHNTAPATRWEDTREPDYSHWDDPDPQAYPTVNPANGLPMVNGSFDIHGNTFGTSSLDFNNPF